VNLETSAIVGVEALVRWCHPERGLVPPAQFIPIAEECGIIVPVGRWVLREACRAACAWHEAGFAALRVAVNVSAVELRDKGFADNLRAILAETGLDPARLELELTEAFLFHDVESTAKVLGALKETGVQLALDDFGTGYSSLSYLKRFPIDALKIDRSFVPSLPAAAKAGGIAAAVIGMGKSLQMRVVAEGIETAEQRAFLHGQGCLEGQGFYFSPAISAKGITQLLMGTTTRASPRSMITS
jgi:EAL domain-containing protein (putative c-di-GMP-specific phosphodiesterase class I)